MLAVIAELKAIQKAEREIRQFNRDAKGKGKPVSAPGKENAPGA